MSYPVERSGGNVLTNKVGPLPLWAWAAVGLLFAVLFYLWNKNKSNKANSGVNTPGGVDASLVPQFVNQDYINITPPPAPSVPAKEKEPDNDKDDKLRGKPIKGRPIQPGGFNHYRTVTVTKTGWASTLEGIAMHYDVDSVKELAKLNGIPSTAHLHVGQKIRVPTNG